MTVVEIDSARPSDTHLPGRSSDLPADAFDLPLPRTDRPSKRELLELIMAEADCSRRAARGFNRMIFWQIMSARYTLVGTSRTVHLSGWALRHHEVFIRVMPDQAIATPASAHEATELRYLRADRGEISLTHVQNRNKKVGKSCGVMLQLTCSNKRPKRRWSGWF